MTKHPYDEAKVRATARELAANIYAVKNHWPIAATAAMSAVRRRLPLGACNRFMSDQSAFAGGGGMLGLSAFAGEVKRVFASRAANVEIDEAVDAWGIPESVISQGNCTDPIRTEMAEAMGYLAIKLGGGNCQYQAGATYMALREAGVAPIDLIMIFRRGGTFTSESRRHATVVIGIQSGFPNQRQPEFSRWQPNAVVADTWETDRSEAPAELAARYPVADHIFLSFARWEG
ncbi:hypothetical protein ACE7GA_08990 [Roseomonas sp. CCTCC AB2023176]|uniref:hypothetical protein n=1 Tax=Roseomonas sp. CCTCC AB2023176 TaxID=3342640 RepID=UPI0035D973E0